MSPANGPYDVLIAGGGPAGSAAAIAAARHGLRVLLAERHEPPLRKVCGEFLSANGAEIWQQLTGLDLPASAPEIRGVRFLDGRRSGPVIPIEPHAVGLTRAFLDSALLRAASRAGAEVRTGTALLGYERAAGDFRVRLRGSGEMELRVPRLVLATGRPVEKGPRGRWWIGRKGVASGARMEADLEMLLLPGGGYVGVCGTETGQMSVCALVRDGGGEWLTHPALRGARLEASAAIARFRLGLQGAPRDGAQRVGDALAVWPPLVGEGITVAMISGSLLGDHLGTSRHASLEDAAAAWEDAWRGSFLHRLSFSLLLHRAAGTVAGRRAFLALTQAFPRLGRGLVRATRCAQGHRAR